jgi:hypothetical protein
VDSRVSERLRTGGLEESSENKKGNLRQDDAANWGNVYLERCLRESASVLNRCCPFDTRLESMLLRDPPQNPFATGSCTAVIISSHRRTVAKNNLSPPSATTGVGSSMLEARTTPPTTSCRIGQPSLLVRHWSSAERRWIEAHQASALGSFVDRRYSGCTVDNCRNVSSVGQPETMRLRQVG